mgnify:CR=1 FL=1
MGGTVKIRVGSLELASDTNGWSVGSVRTVEKGERAGEEVVRDVRFYGRLTHALEAMQDRALRDSDASTLLELRAELDSFRAQLASFFRLEAVG